MLDTLSDLQMTVITQLDSLPEAKCESLHESSVCSVEVRWSRPPHPCGCYPRLLVCQRDHDHVFNPWWFLFRCSTCGKAFTAEDCLTGWYPV